MPNVRKYILYSKSGFECESMREIGLSFLPLEHVYRVIDMQSRFENNAKLNTTLIT